VIRNAVSIAMEEEYKESNRWGYNKSAWVPRLERTNMKAMTLRSSYWVSLD
jgi:hypothetical protein